MSRLTVALSGDCMVTRGGLITSDPAAGRLRELLHGADFAVTNLEVVPSEGRGHPVHNAAGGGCLIADSPVLDEITAAGFSVLGCANNHAMDLGTEGVLGTVDLLRARRIPYAGIGADLAGARRPVYADRPGGSLALLSCTATFLPGQEAADPSPELSGRPGLNPLRHTATMLVTAAQMDALRTIDAETGLRARRAEARTLLGVDPALLGPDRLALFGTRFRTADAPGFTTECDPRDLDEISRWVGEARLRADLVVVSVHSHEPGPTPETPGEFLRAFAHRMIDEGADAVVGHGPHFLRGVELYRNKPIFYSLGNIVSQIELTDRVSAEDYAKAPAEQPLTPGRYYDRLSGHGTRLFAPHPRYWQSLVPVLTFDDGTLTAARLHPIDLGFGLPVHRRGRPRLADRTEAEKTLTDVAQLSQPYGTTVEVRDDGTGELMLEVA
ncbi:MULTISPECIES: lasso peptide C-terminal Trp epimerase [unclassified Streptomyces]|uniref:lasso peptide C-terminal Trp epimerase n=1 Tax=unclassified Streptomyces TaxID=2593676 RepID=UPI002475B808|nr:MULTISPECIES: lasso peptide C-terminal Trp epimerase [unclassified Streptomyces]MDH6453372.1 poly-gamma-glutamate capsule biosynthesis protein CapA/YwtB (metallophosphatase superfamily) [Streptomyces sp. SAI-119]MDH6496072.1 poly-gamma-glutamate capsule biosynthesis protein CapA/YwtB (metallophosphatase superfamily) [Streptomyces sp. SAI-149]